jgi:hypothetical protein
MTTESLTFKMCDTVLPNLFVRCFKILNEKLYFFHRLPSIVRIRKYKWAAHLATMGENGKAYRTLLGKCPLGRPRRKYGDDI